MDFGRWAHIEFGGEIKRMIDCNNSEVFLCEYDRMCCLYRPDSCNGCPIDEHKKQFTCNGYIKRYPKTSISLVQQWSDTHPLFNMKTYADVFFEMHPKAQKDCDGIPLIDRCDVFGICNHNYCLHDRYTCWLEPYQE